jgi:hypothetical protein
MVFYLLSSWHFEHMLALRPSVFASVSMANFREESVEEEERCKK